MSDYETVRSWARIGFGFSHGIEPVSEPELSEYRAKQATIDKVLPPKGRLISEETFKCFRELFKHLLDEIADDPASQMDFFGPVGEGPQKWLRGVLEQGRALDIDCWEYWKTERSEYEVNRLMKIYRGDWE
jgi:hypothetical protein